VKLQKHFSRKFKGKEYSKWVVVIPPEMIRKLAWKEGEELEPEIFHSRLILLPKKFKAK
jgi:antitoxin component of MazEF toxin-antitoxin module